MEEFAVFLVMSGISGFIIIILLKTGSVCH